jgi:hypothetical protein
MLLLGLLIVAAIAAFTGLVIADNNTASPQYVVSVLGHHVATVNTLTAFLAGAALALLFCLGLALVSSGSRRAVRRRSDLRQARRDARAAAAERDQMATRVHDDTGPPFAEDPGYPASDASDPEPDQGKPSRHRQGRHLFGH